MCAVVGGRYKVLQCRHRLCAQGAQSRVNMASIGELIVDVPMFEKVQECVVVVRLTPHERVQRRTAGHILDVPVPQIWEEIVEVVRFPWRPRGSMQAIDMVVDMLVEAPQLQQHI